ncbi:MAG: ABC transporter substrate-binding protein [Cetobacterium sp.]|uniref:ABC transporter substrate-binding protein n=1 Tax=Cetobacterium TaxID=180162 RepID=UPI001F0585EE|nr:ABC transporter substrate-binding protein [Cetobacterium somerae]MCX3067741.1 ABC transporter substrate-binding protein [Cetobacterium somerae]UPO99019.1 ABC transporter substrate-binding protein [Cetobacterium somerae]
MKKNILKGIILGSLFLVGCEKEEKTIISNKPIEIEYWHVASESFGGGTIKELVKNFNEKNSDIKVIEKFNPDMYKGLTQNLQVAVAARKKPAIVQMGYSYLNYANDNFDYVTAQEIIEKYFPEDKNYLNNSFLSNILELGQVNGKQVGIPYSISNPIMYINSDLMNEAGIDIANTPKDWETVRKYSEIIKEKTGNMGLFVQEYADNWAQQALIEGNGGKILIEKDGKTIPTFASKEASEAYQYLADMVQDNIALHASNDEGFQTFLNGKLGMVITTIGKRDNFESTANFKIIGEKFPLFNGKERRLPAGGNMLMIMTDNSEEQKASWKFMKYLLEEEASEKWTKGTGYLPSAIQNENSGIAKFLNENQLMRVANEQLTDMGKWASFSGTNALQAEQLLIDVRDVILSGEKKAEQALKEVEEKITNLIK